MSDYASNIDSVCLINVCIIFTVIEAVLPIFLSLQWYSLFIFQQRAKKMKYYFACRKTSSMLYRMWNEILRICAVSAQFWYWQSKWTDWFIHMDPILHSNFRRERKIDADKRSLKTMQQCYSSYGEPHSAEAYTAQQELRSYSRKDCIHCRSLGFCCCSCIYAYKDILFLVQDLTLHYLTFGVSCSYAAQCWDHLGPFWGHSELAQCTSPTTKCR